MKKVVSIVTMVCFILFSTGICLAEPVVTNLKKGQAAPFDGALYNSEAQAKILADKQTNAELCKLKAEYTKKKGDANCQFLTESISIELDSEKSKSKAILDIKNNEIKELRKLISERKDWSKWWFVGGVLTGTAAVLGVLFAAQKIREN